MLYISVCAEDAVANRKQENKNPSSRHQNMTAHVIASNQFHRQGFTGVLILPKLIFTVKIRLIEFPI